jgi:hypothetical protein
MTRIPQEAIFFDGISDERKEKAGQLPLIVFALLTSVGNGNREEAAGFPEGSG